MTGGSESAAFGDGFATPANDCRTALDLLLARLPPGFIDRVLNLTSGIRLSAHGAQQLLAYCAGERGRVQSQAFCTLAERKAAGDGAIS